MDVTDSFSIDLQTSQKNSIDSVISMSQEHTEPLNTASTSTSGQQERHHSTVRSLILTLK